MSGWIDLRHELPGLLGRGVHVMAAGDETRLGAVLDRHGFHRYVLEGARIADKASFLQEAARSLELPSYFGHNWDALDECLADLAERPARRVAILWRGAERCAAADLQTLLDAAAVLSRAAGVLAEAGTEDGTPLQLEVFLLGTGDGFPP